ncbi:MAG: right-handed parallel beta-helix repeat-containing protein [Planctomycetota bacterium]
MTRTAAPRTLHAIAAILACSHAALAQLGSLTPPPGPVAETMKPLEVVEPRTAVGPDTTPGDADSVFIITEPGSYYLVESIEAGAGRNGITILTSNVTLDLNGFEIVGDHGGIVNRARRDETASAPDRGLGPGPTPDGRGIVNPGDGAFSGIDIPSFVQGLVVHNGTIRDWSGAGVQFRADDATVRDLTVISCALWGIDAQNSFSVVIERVSAVGCGGGDDDTGGFRITERSRVVDCIARACGAGFDHTGTAAIFERCIATNSVRDGFVFSGQAGATLTACVSERNLGNGFAIAGSPKLAFVDCSADQNNLNGFALIDPVDQTTTPDMRLTRCSASDNALSGFVVTTTGTALTECTAQENSSSGFRIVDRDQTIEEGAARLKSCVADRNNAAGFETLSAEAVFVDCLSTATSGPGFFRSARSNLERCVAIANSLGGFNSDGVDTFYNSCIAERNGSHGFVVGVRTTLTGCNALDNSGVAVRASSDATIEGGEFVNNLSGGVEVSGASVVRDARIQGFGDHGELVSLVGRFRVALERRGLGHGLSESNDGIGNLDFDACVHLAQVVHDAVHVQFSSPGDDVFARLLDLGLGQRIRLGNLPEALGHFGEVSRVHGFDGHLDDRGIREL